MGRGQGGSFTREGKLRAEGGGAAMNRFNLSETWGPPRGSFAVEDTGRL